VTRSLFRPRAVAAALAVAAAVCVPMANGPASASPVTAVAPAAAKPSAPRPVPAGLPRSALLISGDRVVAGSSIAVIPASGADRAGADLELSFASRHYVIPSDAVPYLGRGLDMSLFDVGAVAGLERGGALPVRISYFGRAPRLPGVTITGASGHTASGYLTAASARVFGAALARQFASDRSRGGYGADGMFADGVRIGLAGTAAPPPAAPRSAYPMHTLTVDGTDSSGHPDTGDLVLVANVNNPGLFGESFDAINDFYKGTAKFSVPAGTYWAVGIFSPGVGVSFGGARPRPGPADSATRVVALTQFTISADRTVRADARTATSKMTVAVPRPAIPAIATLTIGRISAGGQSYEVGVTPVLNAVLYVNPTRHPPADGTLQAFSAMQLDSPATAVSPYQYYANIKDPKGIIPPQNFQLSAASLATVHENLYADVPGTGSFIAFSLIPGEPGSTAVLPRLAVPGRDTLYLSTGGGSFAWQGIYTQDYSSVSGGQMGAWARYRPGQVATEDWNAYPLHTAPNVDVSGDALNGDMIVSANRSGNVLTLAFMPFTDSVPGHLGAGYTPVGAGTVSGTYQIRQNGTTIASGSALNSPGIPTGEIYQQATPSPKPSVISFTLTARRTGRQSTLSTATATTWTWRSAHESGATVPPWWYCSFASNHNCAAQPLLMLRYAVRGLGLDGAAPPGAQSLAVTAGQLPLAAAQKVTKVTVQVSVNDGGTWASAAVTGSGGSYRARFTTPAGRYVTLRVTAADAAGGQVSETITRAYATAS